MIAMLPHFPHHLPQLGDELGGPGISCASAACVCVVDLLIGSQRGGNAPHEKVFPSQLVLVMDGCLQGSVSLHWEEGVLTLPQGQALEDGCL